MNSRFKTIKSQQETAEELRSLDSFSSAGTITINCIRSNIVETFAVNCRLPFSKNQAQSEAVRGFLANALSPATRRAYQSDLAHFENWGGSVPTKSETIAAYIAELAETEKVATLQRRIASLSKAHEALGLNNPTKAEIVRGTMRGIKRTFGSAQRQAKPLLKEDLFAILQAMGDRPKDVRDKALLLIGFAGALRRSELVALDVADIDHVRQGLILTIRKSKTDQYGAGRKIGIPFGRTRWCPVKALDTWLEISQNFAEPIFRPIDRHGVINETRLTGEAVALVIKDRAAKAGFDPACYSGHSLRAGLATSASMAGVPSHKIRQQTGHSSDAMLSRYIREGNLFTNNAAGLVL